jgi:acetoin:2,6-dichlorophenolindophenol oxidoreductase subunit alpha
MSGNQPDIARLTAHYRAMWRIRAFEDAAEEAARNGQVTGAVHSSAGQEAVPVGVCANLRRDDMITSTHRGHGHTLAKGADAVAMMCELFGRAGGTSGGKGGSMHIADFRVGMLGANGVVADGIPIAVGAAQAARLLGQDKVVACFFGDGAINRGPFLEGLNWAAIYKLPVLFVCELNSFASTTRVESVTAGPGVAARAEALGVPSATVDGNDVVAVDDLAATLIVRTRAGNGPALIAARTYRLRGHTAADEAPYRAASEVETRMADEPILRAGRLLLQHGVTQAVLDAARDAAIAEMAQAVANADAAPWPDLAEAYRDVQDVGSPRGQP